MTRRIAVLVVGTALLLVFGLVGAAVPVPYVAQMPGPTYNTLGDIRGQQIITLQGRARNHADGNLNLTTVGVSRGRLTLVQAVRGWFDKNVAVVPEEAVYPPDQTPAQTQTANRNAFLTSEQSAESAALGHLGYPKKVVVQDFSAGSPSKSALQKGDAIDAVNGQPTPDPDTLNKVLTAIPGGSSVTVSYTRLGQPGTATVTTNPAKDRAGSLLGILVIEQPSAPFNVDIQVADVGGPSAGLMLTLGILDLVGPQDLTGGKVVAGTGTIDADGKVGPIGGIQLKMVAAQNIGATLFLVPADNCSEAAAAPQPGLRLAKVSDLDSALTALTDFRSGRTPPSC
ncbi:MAG: putative secreted protein containing a domain [Frankiales bacterium]|nr:putative secreted protein containing a domain [Frankiales bacterium]